MNVNPTKPNKPTSKKNTLPAMRERERERVVDPPRPMPFETGGFQCWAVEPFCLQSWAVEPLLPECACRLV